MFGVAWQLVPPVTHAPTSHLNWEVQIMGTRWTLGGHTSDTRWTQRWTHDGHCENTAFCARPRTSNSRTKQVPKGAYVSSCFCSVHRVSIVVSIVRPPRVHRCVRRCLVSSWPSRIIVPMSVPLGAERKSKLKSPASRQPLCADVGAHGSRADRRT